MQLKSYFLLVRWPNLLMVALTQYLLQYLVLSPALAQAGRSPTLDPLHFFLLVFVTVIIAAGGYIINDLFDYEADVVNKPDKVFIHAHIKRDHAIWLYAKLVVLGSIIALYLANHVEERRLVLIYPSAVGLLWLYSRYFKKMPLIGNVVVAVFCAFVAGVVLFAERKAFSDLATEQPALAGKVSLLFGGYLLFAFLSTLFREIVKDMEDAAGDKAQSVQSLPVAYGMAAAKNWGFASALLLLSSLLYFSKWLIENRQWIGLSFTWISIVLPLLYAMFLLKKAAGKSDCTRLSKLAKYIMLAGLILLLLIWK